MKSIYTFVKALLTINMLATLILCFENSLMAQNSAWSLAPKYSKYNNLSSLPTSSSGYQSTPASTASNMQLDAQNNILFFIVDNQVYNKNGDQIGQLTGDGVYPVKGDCEIAIVPDPANCDRYYIITSARDGTWNTEIPFYAVLDMAQQNPDNSQIMGELQPVLNNNGVPTPYNAMSLRDLVTDGSYPSPMKDKQGTFSVAVSDLRSNNSRFVFINNSNRILRFIIDNTGIQFDGSIPIFSGNNLTFSQTKHVETELVQISNGNYRIAVPVSNTDSLSLYNAFSVYTAELNANGTVINSAWIRFARNTNINQSFTIKGIEFSPNGSRLYINHTYTDINNKPIEYYDFTSQSLTALNLTNANDFQFSQIELGTDGKLYFATSNRMTILSNPNNVQ